MNPLMNTASLFAIILTTCLLSPQTALATQSHGGMEGLYAHQIAHIFFMVAMGFLIFWLSKKHLEEKEGWRSIQIAAFFFILWNADAFLVHFLETQPDLIVITKTAPWTIAIDVAPDRQGLAMLYYAAKLDHLLSLPAMIFLFIGLRRLRHRPPGVTNRAVPR